MKPMTPREFAVRLSRTQVDALVALAAEPLKNDLWHDGSAYSLQVSLATLESLERRRLVVCLNHGALGCGFMPRTVLKWRLTANGQQVVDILEKGEHNEAPNG